jgi:hypothetical protein
MVAIMVVYLGKSDAHMIPFFMAFNIRSISHRTSMLR